MNRQEAIDVLEHISLLYPKMQMSKERAKILLPSVMEMDYKGVMEKLSHHAAMYPYAPTIAEIAVYPKQANQHLENLKKWKAEAALVPNEMKQHFYHELQKLVLEKVKDVQR